jgi:hypothetical protein
MRAQRAAAAAAVAALLLTGCDPFGAAKSTPQKALDTIQAIPGLPDGTAPCDPGRRLPPAATSGPSPIVPPRAGPASPVSPEQAASALPSSPPNGPPVAQPPRPAGPTPRASAITAVTATVGLSEAAKRSADRRPYVSIGDSFASGEGSPDYATSCFDTGTDTPDNHCHRSQEAYSAKVWERLGGGWSLETVACSGGVIDDYFTANTGNAGEPPQRRAVQAGADLVTVNMGGNDSGFAEVLASCIRDVVHPFGVGQGRALEIGADKACRDRINKAERDIERLADEEANDPPTPGGRRGHLLHDFYFSVRDDAPSAKILVLGYQQFFPDELPSRCSTGLIAGYFTRDMMRRLNRVVRAANDAIEEHALNAGLGYVDVENIATSTGNTLCQDDDRRRMQHRFIYTDYKRSFHPTISAHQAMADRVMACVEGQKCGGEPANEHITKTDLDGEVYAFGTHVDPARRILTFNKIDWFEDAQALAACKADKVVVRDNAWCNDYYYRDRNQLLRTASLADAAEVSVLDFNATAAFVPQMPVNLTQLKATIAERQAILVLTVEKGVITRIREVFTP